VTYLLDTHTFLWASHDPDLLSKSAIKVLNDPSAQLQVSIASIWEIGILMSLKRIKLKMKVSDLVQVAQDQGDIEILPISSEHIDKLVSLPFHHRDPFDRLIIAQSLSEKSPLISKDSIADKYSCRRIW
jgi:PIN domain nuclease of toxin-antitoxin system